jgi:hypothetical protein
MVARLLLLVSERAGPPIARRHGIVFRRVGVTENVKLYYRNLDCAFMTFEASGTPCMRPA